MVRYIKVIHKGSNKVYCVLKFIDGYYSGTFLYKDGKFDGIFHKENIVHGKKVNKGILHNIYSSYYFKYEDILEGDFFNEML